MNKNHKILRYENINFEFSLHNYKYFHRSKRKFSTPVSKRMLFLNTPGLKKRMCKKHSIILTKCA